MKRPAKIRQAGMAFKNKKYAYIRKQSPVTAFQP